jgi:two-component system, cell cycle response regulator
MSTIQHIGLAGFSEFEKSVLEALFRLASRTQPHYKLIADPAQANVVIMNGDNAAVVTVFAASKPAGQHVVLVGKSDCGTGWPVLSRPIRLMGVLGAVNALVDGSTPTIASLPVVSAASARAPTPAVALPPAPSFSPVAPAVQAPVLAAQAPAPAVQPAAASPAVAPQRQFQAPQAAPAETASPAPVRLADQLSSARAAKPTAQVPDMLAPMASASKPIAAAPLAQSASAKAAATVRSGFGSSSSSRFGAASDFMGLGAATKPAPLTKDSQFDDILVVDDSDIALKFMQNRLTRYGFRVQLVRSGEEALSNLGNQSFKFVFLDVMMEGLDGYQTCRAIKQRKYPEGKPPVVVMLTSRGGTIDKIRGTLAGCDAYLTKPLNETELVGVLAKHDQSIQRGFQETNFGNSGASLR